MTVLRPAPVLWIASAAAAFVLAWMWFTPEGQLRNAQWDPPLARRTDVASLIPQVPDAQPVDPAALLAMLERPLFSPTRRPPPPPPPPKPVVAEQVDRLQDIKISGIFQGHVSGLILTLDGKHRRLRVGQAVEGWTLRSVGAREATFSRGDETRAVPLQRAALTQFTGVAQPVATGQPAPPPGRAAVPSAVQAAVQAAAAAAAAQNAGGAPAPRAEAATPPATAAPAASAATAPRPVFGGSAR
ncbi:MAG: hypothetical protein ACK40S_00200 [Burkholderiaceae bacterium]